MSFTPKLLPMNYFTKVVLGLLIGSLLFISCGEKEPEEPDPVRRKSPTAIATVKHAGTYVKIVYGQPYKSGREIFGNLVPYGEVWRTGANEATEITATGDIIFAGETLEAGTYSLFTIPNEETWTIILNSELGLWGAFDYDASKDVMRVEAEANRTEQTDEAFTIQFGEVQADSADMIIKWDQTEVRVPITFPAADSSTP